MIFSSEPLPAADELATADDGGGLLAAQRIGGDTVVSTGTSSAGLSSTLDDVPQALRRVVSDPHGRPGTYFQRARIAGDTVVVVGIIPALADAPGPAVSDVRVYGFKSMRRELHLLRRAVLLSMTGAVLLLVRCSPGCVLRLLVSPIRR